MFIRLATDSFMGHVWATLYDLIRDAFEIVIFTYLTNGPYTRMILIYFVMKHFKRIGLLSIKTIIVVQV